ncbi:Uma2 family endonuclease [Streptomyces sp. NBC_01317]|uniref:Uma2 family endonuclease n=1 Tax=Streptomyces sp. NBC_01317 TaxID=2903822 RepID=UPI002E11DF1D|nr:Uma2 family endonuclease [Streptomyces sp. NBC_01317]
MTTHLDDQAWDYLVRVWEGTGAPEGCKVEIVEGIITVSPGPSKEDTFSVSRLHRRLAGVVPEDWEITQTQVVAIPGVGGLYMPDLMVIPAQSMTGPGNTVPAGEALLVVEITSRGNANHDRITKAHGYAKAEAPLYLLLDRWHTGRPTATLYGEPEAGTYRVLASVEYGEKLTLPEPFGLTIDTGESPVN